MKDILGNALKDWHTGNKENILWIDNKYGEPEEMPVSHYFRLEEDIPEIEIYALKQCKGSILDIGAGVGTLSLQLQKNGFKVDALEISSKACEVMKERGVKSIIENDILQTTNHKYDTLLLLMNGIGLAQTIEGLKELLKHLKTLLAPGGQILFDSSDIAYLYEDGIPKSKTYYGEIDFKYRYKKSEGAWFKWLYIDYTYCSEIAQSLGFTSQLLAEDDQGHYLCRLTL